MEGTPKKKCSTAEGTQVHDYTWGKGLRKKNGLSQAQERGKRKVFFKTDSDHGKCCPKQNCQEK